MNRSQLTALVVALACVGAVGVSASTLSSSVAADPSDALDPDYELIPVAGDGLAQLESAIAGGGGTAASGGGGGGDSRGDDRGSAGRNEAPGDGDDETNEGGSDDSGESAGGTGGEDGRSAGDGFGFGAVGGPVDPLALLVLVALLLATAWLCYRYRDRLRALFVTEADEPSTDESRPVPDGPPADDNLVFETWDDLLSDLDVDRPETLTTGECAEAAAAAGFDREEIERLRLDFEAVRYGGHPVTDSRRRRTRTAQKRLGLNGESP